MQLILISFSLSLLPSDLLLVHSLAKFHQATANKIANGGRMQLSENGGQKRVEKHRIDEENGMRMWRRRINGIFNKEYMLVLYLITARRSSQSILKEINPKYSLEGLMLKLKLQYFGHLMQRANSLEKT